MRRLFVLVLALSIPLTSQSPQHYRLHIPTAEDYLAAFPSLIAFSQNDAKSTSDQDAWSFSQIITNELRTNYTDLRNVKFDTLNRATSVIALDPYTDGAYSEYAWHHQVIDAWLRENKVDLLTKKHWQFASYSLDITPVDFNGDRQPELVVEITYHPGDHPLYQELMVMQRDDDAPGKYRPVTLPWTFSYSADCDVHTGCGGGAQTFKIADINGDGLPEWLVAIHDCGYGECGGALIVLGWRHGEMVDLTKGEWRDSLGWTGVAGGGGGLALPPDGTWTFTSSGEPQIIQRYQFHDNRDCEVTYTTGLAWDKYKGAFIPNKLAVAYANSAPCALRSGQDAMGKSDYPAAINAYKRAIELLPTSSEPYAVEALQYAQIRLMLAYALSDETAAALSMRDALQYEIPQSMVMGYLLSAVKAYSGNKVQLCVAVHNAVERFNPYESGDNTDFWIFGQTDDVQGRSMMYVGGDISAGTSGCDVTGLLEALIGKSLINSTGSPQILLNALGVEVSQQFSADLNGDGKTDWLLWFNDLPGQTLLFLSSGKSYTFSLVPIAEPSDKIQLASVRLPWHPGTALAVLGFRNLDHWGADDSEPCGTGQPFGSLTLWEIDKGILQSPSEYLLCEPRSLTQIFPSLYQLRAWLPHEFADEPAAETTFTWNGKDATYDPPAPSQAPAVTTPHECTGQPYHYCGFESPTLKVLNASLSNPPQDASASLLAAIRYTRALLLQRAGNTSAALSDFVALYETAPSAAWKALAALHLRQANGALVAG